MAKANNVVEALLSKGDASELLARLGITTGRDESNEQQDGEKAGDIQVILTAADQSGNTATATAVVTVMQTTSASYPETASLLKAYPSPASEHITVMFDNTGTRPAVLSLLKLMHDDAMTVRKIHIY